MLCMLGIFLAVFVTWGINPVYSILTLITTAFILGITLLQAGLEFVPFLIILIYIGAVSVLFLFVVMMINFRHYHPISIIDGAVFWLLTALNIIDLPLVLVNRSYTYSWVVDSNFYSIGSYTYTTYIVFAVGLVGIILFIAMVAAISLTYISSETYRTQHIPSQMHRGGYTYILT